MKASSSGLDMGSILKYGLIIAGVYLAWRSGLFQTLGLTFLPAPPSGGAAAAVPAGGGGSTALPPANQLTVTPTKTAGGDPVGIPPAASQFLSADQIDTLTKNAASGDVVAAAQVTALGIRYNGHQWNWFREQKTGEVSPATPNLDQVMTASEYLAYRQTNGLSGIRSLAGVPLGAIRMWGARA